ncbi:MAG: MFS transporter [Planctomycetaceae bacterium]
MTAKKSTLLIIFVVVFIDLLGFGIVLPLLPRYGAHFRASEVQLGLLMASFSAMQFLFAPMWGALSDRIGRRPVLLIGLAGSTVAYAMFGVATSLGRHGTLLGLGALPWLFLTRIAAGIAGATIATAQAVIADSTGAENRGRGMALIGAAFGIGFTFGPLIGAAFTTGRPALGLTDDQYAAVAEWPDSDEQISAEQIAADLRARGPLEEADQRLLNEYMKQSRPRNEVRQALLEPPTAAPGYVAALLSGVALLLAIAKLPESRSSGSSSSTAHRRGGLFQLGTMVRQLSSGSFAVILGAIFLTTFAFAQFESTLSLLTRDFGYGSRSNFLLFAYIGAILMLGQGLLVRRLLPRIGEHRMASIGVGLMTVGLLLIGLTGSTILPPRALWFVLPVVTIGFSAVTPSLQSLLSRAASADEQGAVLGSGQSLSSLARILGPAIGVASREFASSTPYYLGGALMLLGGWQVSRIRRTAGTQGSTDESGTMSEPVSGGHSDAS